MHLDLHYVDPRLVALYDIENAGRDDTTFYVQLVADLAARRIVDLGCGTGVLACALATDGRHVVGIDPASAMLAVARRQPNAERVTWLEGDSSALGAAEADLVLMTGNVAQVFLDDALWSATLRDIHAALRPGGTLAFESRNPDVRPWEQWDRASTYEQLDSPSGPMECWLEVKHVADGRVRMAGHNVFTATGEVVVAPSELRFRSHAQLTDSLIDAGFTIEQVYGNWQREPFVATSRLMVFIARRAR